VSTVAACSSECCSVFSSVIVAVCCRGSRH